MVLELELVAVAVDDALVNDFDLPVFRQQDFHRLKAIGDDIANLKDLAHPTAPQQRDDLVVTDSFPYFEGHGGFRILPCGRKIENLRIGWTASSRTS